MTPRTTLLSWSRVLGSSLALLLGLAACGADPETLEEPGGPASAEALGLATHQATQETPESAGGQASAGAAEGAGATGEGSADGAADPRPEGATCDDGSQCKSGSCVDAVCSRPGDTIVIGTIIIE